MLFSYLFSFWVCVHLLKLICCFAFACWFVLGLIVFGLLLWFWFWDLFVYLIVLLLVVYVIILPFCYFVCFFVCVSC